MTTPTPQPAPTPAETKETDKAMFRARWAMGYMRVSEGEVVDADFARTLERQRDEARARVKELDGLLTALQEAATADKQRLDWLERFLQTGNSSVFTTCSGESHKGRPDDTDETRWNHDFCIGYEVEVEQRGCYRWKEKSNKSRNIRSAIDAAKKNHST